MFDNINVRPQAPYPQTVTVHEHRAATDESIRLLAEMQEKARRSLIESADVKDNQLSFTYQCTASFPLEIRSYTSRFHLMVMSTSLSGEWITALTWKRPRPH